MPEQKTFKQLAENYSIEIPRIQRDYAQGRLSGRAIEIRKSLIDTIVSVLNDPHRTKDFNFVYGSVSDGRFIPLDGQQRLTTFFLLHFYLESLSPVQSFVNYKFTYDTRESSRLFCQHLLTNRKAVMAEVKQQFEVYRQIEKARKIKDKEERNRQLGQLTLKTPSQIIRNESWFLSQWESDPTVAGMLVMLDEIHSRYIDDFQRVEYVYKRLFVDEALTFQFQSLKHFTRTDDLFIKMNSRGLGLTDFEIFKSKIVEDFEKKLPEKAKDFKIKIDTNWADYIWRNLRASIKECSGVKDGQPVTNIDIVFQRLLKFLIPVEAAALGQKGINKYAENLFEANGKSMRFAHNQYIKYGIEFSPELLDRIYNDFTYLLTADSTPLKIDDQSQFSYWGNNPFLLMLTNGDRPIYPKIAMMYAFMRYDVLALNRKEKDVWLRTINFILTDSYIDGPDQLINAIGSINILLESYATSGTDVYTWLANCPIAPDKLPGISTYQLEEEIVKAKLRISADDWGVEIANAENNSYLKGQIGFLLLFAGIAKYDSSLQIVDNADLTDARTKFNEYFVKTEALFNNFDANNCVINDYLLVKALLKHGNYLINKCNIANNLTDRDYSWHALLNVGRKHDNSRKYFKQLLDNKLFDKDDVVKSLRSIIDAVDNDLPEWRKILTGEFATEILKRSKKNFLNLWKPDGIKQTNVRIVGTTRLSGYHDELYSYFVYLELKKEFGNLINYRSVKGRSNNAGIILPKKRDDDNETVILTHWDDEWRFIKDENIIERRSCTTSQIIKWLKAELESIRQNNTISTDSQS